MSWFAAANVLRTRARILQADGAGFSEEQLQAVRDALVIFTSDALAAVQREVAIREIEALAAELDRRGRDDVTQKSRP